jgi:type IV pilus assembly protein PilF
MATLSFPLSFRKVGLVWRIHLLSLTRLFLSLMYLTTATAFAQQEARVQARLALASAYLHAGMLTVAMAETDKALEASGQVPEALALKAVIYQHQARLDMAEQYFQQASLLAPQSPQIAHNWAVLACQQGRFELAFAKFALAEAHSAGLERDKSLWLWGECLRQNNQWDAADSKMSRALLSQPSFISEGLKLASLKIRLGKDAEAEKILDWVNDSPSVSAQSLWLAVELAQRQNQAVKKNHWGKMLGLLFSNSTQWRAYQEEVSHD